MHFNKIEFKRFKQFTNGSIKLKDSLSLVVGGNNAGKSSILQALAVWEFCKTMSEFVKGRESLAVGGAAQGIGISISDFSPISVPSLKHLWTNLKTQKVHELDGYTLKIKAAWTLLDGNDKHLEFGLSIANDRLFIKTTSTNLNLAEIESPEKEPKAGVIPRVAYLPPFAGITDRESRYSVALRNRLIGQGLSGGVIRNVVYDLWLQNKEKRRVLRGDRTKIRSADLALLRLNDPWEILCSALLELFGMGITVNEFDDRYHTYLHIETKRSGSKESSRDLMVEGSGFLQWLSVYALALSPDIDVVLLDEPDAHLHCSLQLQLVSYLSILAEQKEKQVLMATHSTELIKSFDFQSILEVNSGKAKYLGQNDQKIGLLAGIGTAFAPKLHALAAKKRMLILEGDFDEKILKIWSIVLGIEWPENVVIWQWPGGLKERRGLFSQIKRDIPDLRAISLRDRDEEADATVGADLIDKGYKNSNDGFEAIKWRRRHIDNYLLHPDAIARVSASTPQEIASLIADNFGLALPANVTASSVVMAVRDARGKEIFIEGAASLESILHIKRHKVGEEMLPAEVAEDIVTFLNLLRDFAA